MKLSCTQENLHRGLEIVSRASGRNTALPILSNVLLRAEPTGLRLTATNLEIGLTCLVRGKVEREGAYTVQGRLLNELVGLLSGDRIDLSLEDGSLSVVNKETKTSLKGLAADEFPLIPPIVRKNPISLPVAHLKQAISQTIFASAYDASRPEINGVLIKTEGKSLTLAATDSYRLAERRLALSVAAEPVSAIVPVRALQELVRILDGEAETASLFISENQLLVSVGDIELVSRLIEGQYPNYEQIIPKDSKTQATLSVSELTRVVKAASLFCKSGINDVALAFSDKGQLTVSAANAQVGENTTTISCEIKGPSNSAVFNYRYLLDGLASLDTPTAQIELTDPESPGLIRPTNDQPHLYLIMPIRQ